VAEWVEHVEADVLDDMDSRHQRRERFGVVIVDPPAFTRSRKHVPAARKALRLLNRRALTLVEQEGVLVSASCSQHVTQGTFLDVLAQAARDVGRPLRLLEVRGAAPDHPVPAGLPESRYLTCVIAQLD
jgi:23S rRNA (cytosine1962-C5)-methyltransferase